MDTIQEVNEEDFDDLDVIFNNFPQTDDEKMNLIDISHIYEEIPSIELSFDFSSINQIIPTLRNHQILTIRNTPSMISALNSILIFVRGFFIRFWSALCIHFKIREKVDELDDFQLHDFVKCFEGFQKSFLIVFESMADGSCLIYWRLKETEQIFSLLIGGNAVDFGKFVEEFLFKMLKENCNGIHHSINYPIHRIRVMVHSYMLADQRGYDLLFLAVESGRIELVNHLLNICDIKYTVEGRTAADIAYNMNHFEILFILLKENSKFPVDFKILKNVELPENLMNFIENSKKIHEAIHALDEDTVLEIIEQNPNLRFFYDTKNNSAMAVSITSKAFDIYKLFLSKNITLGPHEIISDLLSHLTDSQRAKLGEVNEEGFQPIADKHILTLMANTNVGPDDNQRQYRLNLVYSALQKLNTISVIKLILEIVAASRNFQLIFDFNREHVQFLDPKIEGYTNGLFYLNGRIYIAAMKLLDEWTENEVLGVIAHELCHFVMFKVFDNMAKPYRVDDKNNEVEFDKIMVKCKELKGEVIVEKVFSDYDEEQQAAELIVRYPHALGHYYFDEEKIQEFEENYKELCEFFNEKCLPVMERKLPIIEKESEDKIRNEYVKPLNFLRLYWKKILWSLTFIIFLTLFSMFIANSCLFKHCGGRDTFCGYKNFIGICECRNDLKWENQSCFECLINSHCHSNYSCYKNKCADNLYLFECRDKRMIVSKDKRCNGVIDCSDGSDEEYHCITGSSSEGEFETDLKASIDEDDFLIIPPKEHADITKLFMEVDKELIPSLFIPVNISKTFKNIKFMQLKNCHNIHVLKSNFWGLKKLKSLILSVCFIEFLEPHSFEDLISLKTLQVNKSGLFFLDEKSFVDLSSLTSLCFFDNMKSKFDKKYFDKLINLKSIDLSLNRIHSIHPQLFSTVILVERISLIRNKLATIEAETFRNNKNLKTLLLNSNFITEIHQDAFVNLMKLETLYLTINHLNSLNSIHTRNLIKLQDFSIKSNGLNEIDVNLFANSPNIKSINFEDNLIKLLPANLFKNNLKLESISFESNKIKKIDQNIFDNLQNLTWLNLQRNSCIDRHFGVKRNRSKPFDKKKLKEALFSCK